MVSSDRADVDGREPPSPDQKRPAPSNSVSQVIVPAKVVRLLGALSMGLEELNRVNLDDAARRGLIAAQRAVLIEVASTVPEALVDELVALRFAPLDHDATVDEIKVAQAQLLGWVNGVILAVANFGTPALNDAQDSGSLDGSSVDLANR
jgi:hypothetical protein